MKTELEIKEKIKQLKASLKWYPDMLPFPKRYYRQIVEEQIRALSWALGRKYKTGYFCTACLLVHTNEECPECGSDRVIGKAEVD